MTNHPGRARGDDEQPPVHTPNGHGSPAGLQANAAKIIGQTIADTLAESLPQAMYAALAAQRPPCATCVIQRVTWENLHRAEMDTAMAAAAQAGQQDISPYLPAGLRPGEQGGIPAVTQSVTSFQGTELCVAHLGDAAGIRPGKSPLLVATATVAGNLTG